MLDTGDNPDAPAPREMIDLEVPVPLQFLVSTEYNVFFCLFRD